ncbi:MAG: hypothetical protein EA379_00755 [Phycisphaerales bacterium]|nr:MAG: hypothetical protein EA379_00755 [Phycisphaerales bacterium]
MPLLRRTRVLAALAGLCVVVTLAVLIVTLHTPTRTWLLDRPVVRDAAVATMQTVSAGAWRRQYQRWEPPAHAPEAVRAKALRLSEIGATREWTSHEVDELLSTLERGVAVYAAGARGEPAPAGSGVPLATGEDARWMIIAVDRAMDVITDRLLLGPALDVALRERVIGHVRGYLDHADPTVRAAAAGVLIDTWAAWEDEALHGRLLAMQHADPSERVRGTIQGRLHESAFDRELVARGEKPDPRNIRR